MGSMVQNCGKFSGKRCVDKRPFLMVARRRHPNSSTVLCSTFHFDKKRQSYIAMEPYRTIHNGAILQTNDLICTTPRLCQNNMTPAAVRGRGTTSAYNCFPATGLFFKSKVLASVGRGSTETTRLQHGSSMFGDTHAKGGGGSSDKHGYMAFLILAK